jgi:predicted dehydrogenase
VVKAAARYRRVIQATHGPRNNGAVEPALAWVRAGNLGRVRYVHGLNYKPRTSIGKVAAPQPIPEGCDYDLWCGPAPRKPLHREYLHYDWHWDWDTGNGDLGNMGIHFMDACRWATGQQTLPPRVLTIGGRLGYDDDGETPNTLVTLLDYEPVPIIFEVRGLPSSARHLNTAWDRKAGETMDEYLGMRLGVIIHCEGGTLRFGSGKGCTAHDLQGRRMREFQGERVGTEQNFMDVVRSRRVADLHTPAIDGHLSCGLVHLTNISHRVGQGTPPQHLREACRADSNFSEALDRMLVHLAANEIDLERTPLTLGSALAFAPTTERFVGAGSEAANPLLSRDYRPPYQMPDGI